MTGGEKSEILEKTDKVSRKLSLSVWPAYSE